MIGKLWYSQFPEWARPQHPIMRSIMGPTYGHTRRRVLLRWGLIVVLLALVIIATLLLNEDLSARELLYSPLVLAQSVAVITGLVMTANVVAVEEQRGTWDTLKLTLVGVPLTLRARWIAVFHQLRWLLVLIVLGRIAYVVALLYDITDFQGRALDLYISGISPEISLDVSILLMVAFMTAFIMQPVVMVAVSAAIGIVVSVVIRSRALVFILMLLGVGMYVGVTYAGVYLGEEVIVNRTQTLVPEEINADEGWAVLALMTIGGDMGIELTKLETQGQVWADINYGVVWGAIYLGIIVVLGMIANIAVILAAKRAALPSRR